MVHFWFCSFNFVLISIIELTCYFLSVSLLPLHVQKVHSTTGPGTALSNALWHSYTTTNEVELLWHDPLMQGWQHRTAYLWRLTFRPSLGPHEVREIGIICLVLWGLMCRVGCIPCGTPTKWHTTEDVVTRGVPWDAGMAAPHHLHVPLAPHLQTLTGPHEVLETIINIMILNNKLVLIVTKLSRWLLV